MLRAQGLARSYAGRPALRNVSLEVLPGEIVALLGPNGAGKSTLLQILAGVLRADAGTAQVADVEIPGGERALHMRVGFVPQGESVYPELTVRENLLFFAKLHGLKRDAADARVRQLMAETHLADRAATPAGDLSGGLRQRVALAASLVHDPEVLLLDEPGTGLDPVARDRLADVMRGARSQGRVVLFSTHSFEEARRVADRVVLLGRGEVVATGPASDMARWEERFRRMEGA